MRRRPPPAVFRARAISFSFQGRGMGVTGYVGGGRACSESSAHSRTTVLPSATRCFPSASLVDAVSRINDDGRVGLRVVVITMVAPIAQGLVGALRELG